MFNVVVSVWKWVFILACSILITKPKIPLGSAILPGRETGRGRRRTGGIKLRIER